MADIKIGAEDQTGYTGVKARFNRSHQSDIARAFPLRVSTHAACSAQIHTLGAVQIAAGQLTAGFHQHIRTIAQPLHSRRIELAFGETAFNVIAVAKARIQTYRTTGEFYTIIKDKAIAPFEAIQSDIDPMRTLFLIQVGKQGIFILQPAMVITIFEGQATVGQVIDGAMAKYAEGLRGAIHVHALQTGLIIHAAETEAQRCTAAPHNGFIVGIVVVHIPIGQQHTHGNLVPVAADVVEIFLQAITVLARILAAIVFYIKNGIFTLAPFNAHSQVTGAEFLAGTQYTNSLGTAHIRNGIQGGFELARTDDVAGFQAVHKAFGNPFFQTAAVIDFDFTVTAWNNLDGNHTVTAFLCRHIGCCRRIAMLPAVAGECRERSIELRHGLFLPHAVLQNFSQFPFVQIEVRGLQTEVGNGKFHLRSLLGLVRCSIHHLGLRFGKFFLYILSGLGQ